MKKKVLVLGFGRASPNVDNMTVCVIDYLRQRTQADNLELIDSRNDKNLSECIESTEQLIVVDTSNAQSSSTNVRVYEGIEMDAFVNHRKNSDVHDNHLRDALGKAASHGKLPRHRALVGIQAADGDFDPGSVNMSLILGRACQKIFALTECWKV